MCVGVAGYPEKHPQAATLDEDIEYLKRKVDQGGSFIITQLFFDNDLYFAFVDKCRARGISVPIVPGVLPILSLASIKRSISLGGTTIPEAYLARLEAADKEGGAAAVREIGVEYAREQCRDLLKRGAPGVHLYTLNKAQACLDIARGLRLG